MTDQNRPVSIVETKNEMEFQRFRVVRVKYELASGRHAERDVVRHPGAVTILPMIDDDHVCLIRNLRPAVGETLIELPAGTLEPNEPPLETAYRELTEETGYVASAMEPIHSFYLSPGILDERMHLFVATGLQPGEQQLEADEQIENLILSWNEAMDLVSSGQIEDAKTLVGLMFYQQLRSRRHEEQ